MARRRTLCPKKELERVQVIVATSPLASCSTRSIVQSRSPTERVDQPSVRRNNPHPKRARCSDTIDAVASSSLKSP